MLKTGMRGYLLTKRREFLDPYVTASQNSALQCQIYVL